MSFSDRSKSWTDLSGAVLASRLARDAGYLHYKPNGELPWCGAYPVIGCTTRADLVTCLSCQVAILEREQ